MPPYPHHDGAPPRRFQFPVFLETELAQPYLGDAPEAESPPDFQYLQDFHGLGVNPPFMCDSPERHFKNGSHLFRSSPNRDFPLKTRSGSKITRLPASSKRYPKDIEKNKNTDAGDSPDCTDVEVVHDYENYQPCNRVFDQHGKFFDQVVYDCNNCHNKEDCNDD